MGRQQQSRAFGEGARELSAQSYPALSALSRVWCCSLATWLGGSMRLRSARRSKQLFKMPGGPCTLLAGRRLPEGLVGTVPTPASPFGRLLAPPQAETPALRVWFSSSSLQFFLQVKKPPLLIKEISRDECEKPLRADAGSSASQGVFSWSYRHGLTGKGGIAVRELSTRCLAAGAELRPGTREQGGSAA